MEQHIICIFIDYRGHHRKGVEFIMPLKSVHNRSFGFIEQKKYFWTLQRVSNKKNSINWHYFCHEKISVDLFSAAPYMLLLVLHKDALFHWSHSYRSKKLTPTGQRKKIITKPHKSCIFLIFSNNFKDTKGTKMADPILEFSLKTICDDISATK